MSANVYSGRGRLYSLDRLFWDFDSDRVPPDLDAAWRDALSLQTTMDRLHGVKGLIVSSGMKGYHVYAFLSRPITVKPEHERVAKIAVRIIQAHLTQGLKLPTIDGAVLGDIARLARVPYTMHHPKELPDGTMLPGGLCQPLTPERRPLLVEAPDLNDLRAGGVPAEVVGDAIRSAWVGEEIQRERWQESREQTGPSTRGVRPCIEEATRGGDMPNLMRLACATELIAEGASDSEIVSLLAKSPDPGDQRRTRYYVEHAKRRGYRPFMCVTIRSLGFCLGDGCPIYRRRHG
jgi:hypothetical protein